jgi:hypothetical protein
VQSAAVAIAGWRGAGHDADKGVPLAANADPSRSCSRVTEDEMRKRLTALRLEHRDLDAAIEALSTAGPGDQLQIARLKKRKLRLKDQISMIEDHLIPDIIA